MRECACQESPIQRIENDQAERDKKTESHIDPRSQRLVRIHQRRRENGAGEKSNLRAEQFAGKYSLRVNT